MYGVSITVDNVIDALADFLQPFCPGAKIVRAQANRVPMPTGPCVVLTELLQVDLETPVVGYDSTQSLANIKGPARVDIQVDFYGPSAGDQCKAVKGVFRTEYAAGKFSDGIKPLYCSDGVQSPLVTGEQQWESRWTLTASLQYNPTVTVPQDFTDVLIPNSVIPADV